MKKWKERENNMGFDCTAITAIGVRVPNHKIIEKKEKLINLCVCKPKTYSENNEMYCSGCGRYLKHKGVIHKPLFNWPEDNGSFNGTTKITRKICGWEVLYSSNERYFFICIFNSGHVDYEKMTEIPHISEKVIEEFKNDMKSVGLWDEEQFGLWTMTFWS